jgi:hypothetical protein
MANTTFSGPVRSENGFQIVSINPTTGTVTVGARLTKILTASASLNFPSINAASQADLTITVTGAAVNDEVVMGLPAAPTAGIVFNAFVSATNTVTIRATNITASPVDPAAATYTVLVFGAA